MEVKCDNCGDNEFEPKSIFMKLIDGVYVFTCKSCEKPFKVDLIIDRVEPVLDSDWEPIDDSLE